MIDYYDKDGSPMAMKEWVRTFEDDDYKRVAFDRVGDVEISTVWLGLNHQYGDGPPLIFETMIFGGEHDEDQWRYETEADAIDGHHAAVALVRDGV